MSRSAIPLVPTVPDVYDKSSDKSNIYASMDASIKAALVTRPFVPLFHADLGPGPNVVGDTWLTNLSGDDVAQWKCNSCLHFMRQYGDLCYIINDHDSGVRRLEPLLWGPTYNASISEYPAIEAIRALFSKSQLISRPFTRVDTCKAYPLMLGTKREDSGYIHMSCTLPITYVEQMTRQEDQFVQDKIMIKNCLAKYDHAIIKRADDLLHNHLDNSEKHRGAIRLLRELSQERERVLEPLNHSEICAKVSELMLWEAATTWLNNAAHSVCGSGMVGGLLEMVHGNKTFDEIRIYWNARSNVTVYMRPTAAPTMGALQAAEKSFESLGITKNDLVRRFLIAEDIPTDVFLYRSSDASKPVSAFSSSSPALSIFGHITPKSSVPKSKQVLSELPPATINITWTRFIEQVLPSLKPSSGIKIEYNLYHIPGQLLGGLITGNFATHPLMQWHTDKNLASGYTYHGDSRPEKWNLRSNTWVDVTSIIPMPHMWPDSQHPERKFCQHGVQYMMALRGAKDTTQSPKGGLFPTFMRSEFHAYRSVIEAHSKDAIIEGDSTRQVCGVIISKQVNNGLHKMLLRVTDSKGQVTIYIITMFE